jgi:hypothetical protein
MSSQNEMYTYVCVLELANQLENRMETPLKIQYSPTGNSFLTSKHFLYHDAAQIDTELEYGVLGRLLSIIYVKSSNAYIANFEKSSIPCYYDPPTNGDNTVYDKIFLYENQKR